MREMIILMGNQDSKCGICECCISFETAAVDHDHKTMKVRGLLCKMCNLRLHVLEDEEYVKRAQIYLESDSESDKNVSS